MGVNTEVRVRNAVKRGAEYLDKNYPWWIDKMDLITLNVACTRTCVFAQLFGHYFNGPKHTDRWLAIHGFGVWGTVWPHYKTGERVTTPFAELTDEWIIQIQARKSRSPSMKTKSVRLTHSSN
jgi:hypothetical protein